MKRRDFLLTILTSAVGAACSSAEGGGPLVTVYKSPT
jgi:hypothetical protein